MECQTRFDLSQGKPVEEPTKRFRTTVQITHKYALTSGYQSTTPATQLQIQEHPYRKWLYHEVKVTKNVTKIINDIKLGRAYAVSDGSYIDKFQIGTASWIIESEDRSEHVRGLCIVPGEDRVQSAYRSKLVGLLAILDKLRLWTEDQALDEGACYIACDGIAALNIAIQSREDQTNPNSKHSDIISAMSRVRRKIKISLHHSHVKGHEDDKKDRDSLSRMEKMNVSMDFYAKQFAKSLIGKKKQFKNFDNHPLGLQLPVMESISITGNMNNRMYNILAGTQLIEYWIGKGRLSKDTLEDIDWKAQEEAQRREYGGIKRFVAKWATGMIGVGKQVKRWKIRHHSNCPMCNEPDEDTEHVLKCSSEVSKELWEEKQWELIVGMYKIHTWPTMIMPIMRELDRWREDSLCDDNIEHLPDIIQSAISQQRKIGWKNFTEGLIGTRWKKCQEFYTNDQDKNWSPDAWAYRFIRLLWKFLFNIWEGRNAYLHETERINELAGKEELLRAITGELDIGLHRLPAADFSYMFRLKKDVLLQKNMEYLKDWLFIIRTSRKVHKDPAYIQDKFSTDKSLIKWIGTHGNG